MRTQLLVFEQRRRAELYAKYSEAQGNQFFYFLRTPPEQALPTAPSEEKNKRLCLFFPNAGEMQALLTLAYFITVSYFIQ